MNLTAIVEAYLHDLENGMSGVELNRYYAPGAEQIEYPNRLVPDGATRDLTALQDGSVKGKRVLSKQKLDIIKSYESGNTVIVEAVWVGTLALPIGQIPIGGEMKAYFAQFFEFEGDKIIRQRNYDCFEPF
jgi:hypothetical protein